MLSPSQIMQNIWPGLDMIPIFLYFSAITLAIVDSMTVGRIKHNTRVWRRYIEGILPKGPHPPCSRMADSALLAGYPRYLIMLSANVGHFVEPSVCQKILFSVVPCLAPPHPDHGIWTWDAVNYGTILFQCMPGFLLEGYNSSTCYNGRWQRRNPICIGRWY